jgi:LPXTG-motif cell wall-anchored protein
MLALFLGLSMAFGALFGLQAQAIADPGDVVINILHTNDVHGRYEYAAGSIIGIDRIAAIKQQMEADGENPVLVDVGDALHGLPIINLSNGLNAVSLMTSAGYDVMTPGNHDYNYGSARLLELAGIASGGGMQMISSNTFNKADGSSFLPQTTVIEVAGVKVGFFGLTTTTTPVVTHPNNVASLEFRAYKASTEAAISTLEAAGADVIVCLAHVSRADTMALVGQLTVKPDVVIDAHDHISTMQTVDGVIITSSGQYEANLGKVTITYNTVSGNVAVGAALLPAADTEPVTPDAATSALLSDIKDAFTADNLVVVGQSAVALSSARPAIRNSEQPLGNLVSDAMREASGADIAVFNGGGIRADIAIGPVTRGNVYGVLPFNNYMVVKQITPSGLKAMMELSVENVPADFGGFLHASGMSVVYDLSKPVGSRVESIVIDGEYLDLTDDQTVFTIAANDFMAAGGDGYSLFANLVTVSELDTLGAVFEKFISETLGGTIPLRYATVEGRLLEAASEAAMDKVAEDLADLVAAAGALKSADYTPASWSALQAALTAAQAAADAAGASYADMAAAIMALQAAQAGLVLADVTDPVTAPAPPGPKPTTPNTGDMAGVAGAAGSVVLLALGSGFIRLKRRKASRAA